MKKFFITVISLLVSISMCISVCAEVNMTDVKIEYTVVDDGPRPVETISVVLAEPEVGSTPCETASTEDSTKSNVTSVSWEGDFDENGLFKYGGTYKVTVGVAAADGLTIYDWYAYNFLINGREGTFIYDGDNTSAGKITFTFAHLGVPHQTHCYCGGDLTLGEHTSHEKYDFKPWNGKKSIPYKDDEAYVYLTKDVVIEETFRVPGGKVLNLCLNGHTILKKGAGRVINIVSGGKLRLCDCSYMKTGKISGGVHEMGGGIHNGGTFVMYGGKIIGNKGQYGAGLWNNYNFAMYGGEICYNKASYGGGLWNANSGDAVLIVYGGSINRNEASCGGGVWNNDNGNFEMLGGEIRENISGLGGGGVWHQGNNFFLKGGEIVKNYSTHGAGIWSQGMFTMSGGKIYYNEAVDPGNNGQDIESYGGGVWVNESIFYMKGGIIVYNSARYGGGGVWVNDTGEFVMQGGSIAANEAPVGGGVYVHAEDGNVGILRISGDSEVVNNTGDAAGGGIYVLGRIEVSGGIINDNFSESGHLNVAVAGDGELIEGTTLPTKFVDVAADAYYYQPVLWAIENGITRGTSEITFSPDEKCNIGEVITFLHRAAGSPQVKTSPLIADVYSWDYYYMPAYWAQSIGIFERALYPNFSANRVGAIFYIWCAAGRPSCNTPVNFTDLNTINGNYIDAISWAVENGITTGTSETTFSPGKSCTRAEIITFLWRAASKGFI